MTVCVNTVRTGAGRTSRMGIRGSKAGSPGRRPDRVRGAETKLSSRRGADTQQRTHGRSSYTFVSTFHSHGYTSSSDASCILLYISNLLVSDIPLPRNANR